MHLPFGKHILRIRGKLPYLIVLLMVWGAVSTADAEIYRWQDENGHWHFSEGPASPEKSARSRNPSAVHPATSQPAISPITPPSGVHGGLLWKISKNGRPPSYLLGTIHSSDPRVTRLRSKVSKALDASDRFVMEMKLDTSAIMQFGAMMMMGQGEDLEAILGSQLFQRVVTAMSGRSMPEMVVRQLKPWVVMAMLSMPPSTGGIILDMVLYQRATSQGKPAAGLESAQEQLAVFEGLSRNDQIELLELTLDQLPSQPALFEKMIEAYASDDLNRITRIAHHYNTRVPSAAAQRFMLRLNDERNNRMVQRIIPYLEQDNSFIAVGALHLAGARGILTQLRSHGYAITSVR